MPQNALTGRRYSGINILIVWDTVIQRGFGTQSWLTFRQALSLGGSVRKGERGTTVVYASRFTPGEAQPVDTGRADTRAGIGFRKRFTVFNTDQCDGLPETLTTRLPPVPDDMIPPIDRCFGDADAKDHGRRAFARQHDETDVILIGVRREGVSVAERGRIGLR